MTPCTAPLERPGGHPASGLPEAWRRALDDLRPIPLPTGEALALDLHRIVKDAQASMTQPRRWEALLTHINRVPHVQDLAARWQVSPTRITILGQRGLTNLRTHVASQTWPDVLRTLAHQPRVVTVPPGTEAAWPVLVTACRTHGRYDLRTAPLEAGTWVLYSGPALIDYRYTPVQAGLILNPDEAAQALKVNVELLETVWPLTQVWRTQDGRYVGRPKHWTVHDWLALLRAAVGEQAAVTPEFVIEAFRDLPDVPAYKDATLHAALRQEPFRAWLGIPAARNRRPRHAAHQPPTT